MVAADSPAWIDDSEKYALVGLAVEFDGSPQPGKLTANLSVLTEATFSLPVHWREWLGSIRADEVGDCNLFLLSKMASATPGVLDAENQKLQQRVWNFYIGLLLASRLAPAHSPIMVTGSCRNGEIDVRQKQDFDFPIPCPFRPYPPVMPGDIHLAAHLGENLGTIATAQVAGGHWRLFRTLSVYTDARVIPEVLDRIHQYCRCIDGLILPAVGKTQQHFKSRTELFIGPRHHELMGELYDVRSAVEHLHENKYLEHFDRTVRLDLLRKEAIAEYIARKALARVIANSALWPHFGNTPALEKFWTLPPTERKSIWGDSIDPLASVAHFNPQFIHNGLLGSP